MNFQKKFKLENIPLTHEEMAILFNFLNNMAKEQLISSFSLEFKEKKNTNYLIIRIYQGDRPFSSKKFYFETSTCLDSGVLKFEELPYFEFDEKTNLLTISSFENLKRYPRVNKIDIEDSSHYYEDLSVLFSMKLQVRVDFPELEDFMEFINNTMKSHKVSCKIRYLKHQNNVNYRNHFKISLCFDGSSEPLISFTVGLRKDSFTIQDNYLLSQYNFLSLGNYSLEKSFSYSKIFNNQILVLEVYQPEDVDLSNKIKRQLEWLKS